MAREGRVFFEEVGDATLLRWLDLELSGYGRHPDVVPLHEVLGVAAGDRLAVHVAAYRTQTGHIWQPEPGQGAPFRHFFVEPLADLASTSARVRGLTPDLVELEFGAHAGAPGYPSRLEFRKVVFEQILLGFRAVLHLRLRDLAP